MEKPLVSIIIPTYNRAHLIGEALDSVRAQTYENWECIVVDDGSSDNTDEVMAAYCKKDSRFRYYHRPDTHKPGGNGARNYGFLMSRGEYVNWFDSDDLFKPQKLELQVKQLLQHENVVVSLCKVEVFDKEKVFVKKSKILNEKSLLRDFICRLLDIGTSQPLWRRNFLEGKLLYDEEIKRGQDLDFLSRMIVDKDFSFKHLDDILVSVRINENSRITKNDYNSESFQAMMKAYDKVYMMVLVNQDETVFRDFMNVYIEKILICIRNNDFKLAHKLIMPKLKDTFKNKTRYWTHLLKILILLKILKITRNKGFYKMKPLFYKK